MPSITGPTVREHRASMESALIDASEELLLESGRLTVALVAQRVGLSRNGMYKYVNGPDDLIEAVATRHLPEWVGAVSSAVAEAGEDARARIRAYVRVNLEQAVGGRHAWRAALASASLSPQARARIAARHAEVESLVRAALDDLRVGDADLVRSAIGALLSAGVSALDRGEAPERIIAFTIDAVESVLACRGGA
ncbi:hypothetical protein PCC79_09760 [Propioniciclava soli]|uniref:HTH tetR-type domain-containing protein n=1 Tax=Propioniciclava soli TaxID=2775081 RepID=A0ABZ3C2V3_9ACTN